MDDHGRDLHAGVATTHALEAVQLVQAPVAARRDESQGDWATLGQLAAVEQAGAPHAAGAPVAAQGPGPLWVANEVNRHPKSGV